MGEKVMGIGKRGKLGRAFNGNVDVSLSLSLSDTSRVGTSPFLCSPGESIGRGKGDDAVGGEGETGLVPEGAAEEEGNGCDIVGACCENVFQIPSLVFLLFRSTRRVQTAEKNVEPLSC